MPYGGATTTCEALSMGVPVLTLYGKDMVGKLSSSILIHSRLNEYVAYSLSAYKEKARKRKILGILTNSERHMVRNQFVSSPACDADRLTQELEKMIKKITQIP